jgi:thiol:disulfide interchange protein
LQQAYSSYNGKGLLMFGQFAKSSKEDVAKFAETFHLTFPVGEENGIAKALEAKGLPTIFFISKDGQVTKQVVGRISSKELSAGIEAIL